MRNRRNFLPVLLLASLALGQTAFDAWCQPVFLAWDEIAVDFLGKMILIATMAGLAGQ